MLVDLVLLDKLAPEKLVSMDLHARIKTAREAKGWSMEQLATAISVAEGLTKPLSWQTVQQWEQGLSAPKRTRMPVVLRILNLTQGDEEAQEAQPVYHITPAAPGVHALVTRLAEILSSADEPARIAIGGLLQEVCKQPASADLNARRIVALLSVEESQVEKSSTSHR